MTKLLKQTLGWTLINVSCKMKVKWEGGTWNNFPLSQRGEHKFKWRLLGGGGGWNSSFLWISIQFQEPPGSKKMIHPLVSFTEDQISEISELGNILWLSSNLTGRPYNGDSRKSWNRFYVKYVWSKHGHILNTVDTFVQRVGLIWQQGGFLLRLFSTQMWLLA